MPCRAQVLSSYVTDLTGISQLELNRSGVPFAEAMGRTPRVARTPGPEARALTLPELLLAARCSRMRPLPWAGLHAFAEGGALFSWGNDWSVVQASHDLLQQPLP